MQSEIMHSQRERGKLFNNKIACCDAHKLSSFVKQDRYTDYLHLTLHALPLKLLCEVVQLHTCPLELRLQDFLAAHEFFT